LQKRIKISHIDNFEQDQIAPLFGPLHLTVKHNLIWNLYLAVDGLVMRGNRGQDQRGEIHGEVEGQVLDRSQNGREQMDFTTEKSETGLSEGYYCFHEEIGKGFERLV
jgi:hypothetical protein